VRLRNVQALLGRPTCLPANTADATALQGVCCRHNAATRQQLRESRTVNILALAYGWAIAQRALAAAAGLTEAV
jgi:hypothetical protein